MNQGRSQKKDLGSVTRIDFHHEKDFILYQERSSGTLEISRLLKWQSVTVKEIDPLKENLQIVDSTIRDLRYLATKIGKLFGFDKGFDSLGN